MLISSSSAWLADAEARRGATHSMHKTTQLRDGIGKNKEQTNLYYINLKQQTIRDQRKDIFYKHFVA